MIFTKGILLFFFVALILRAAGSLAAGPGLFRPWIDALLANFSAWILAGVAGNMAPIWLGFLPALILCPVFPPRHPKLLLLRDFLFLVIIHVFSFRGVDPLMLLIFTVFFLGAGWWGYETSIRWDIGRRQRLAVGLVSLLIVASLFKAGELKLMTQMYSQFAWTLGFFPHWRGQQIDVAKNVRGYFSLSPNRWGRPHRGALLFHGTNPLGSQQVSAVFIRKALLSAGYDVVSIDHRGYGQSPNVGLAEPLTEWDPGQGGLAAYRWYRARYPNAPIIAVGHSMGAGDVMRLAQDKLDLKSLVLLGAGLNDPSNRDDYWYGRFISDRRIPYALPRATWEKVWKKYYNRGNLAKAMPYGHPPVLFIRFEREHKNLIENRDKLFNLIPGRKTKWDLEGSGHYLDCQENFDMVLADVRIMRRLVQRLSRLP